MSNLDLKKENINVELVEGKITFKNYDEIKTEVNRQLETFRALSLENADKKELKSSRTILNKLSSKLNSTRIEKQKEYMIPFDNFKNQVNELKNLIDDTSQELKEQIDKVENAEKEKKEKSARIFFQDLQSTYAKGEPLIEIIDFDDVGLNITLSVSENKLQEEIETYLQQKMNDLISLKSFENNERLLVKYKKHKDLARAIQEVNEELKAEQELKDAKPIQEVKEVKEIQENDTIQELLSIKFEVIAPKQKLKELKEFLVLNNYEFKNIK